MSKPTGNPRLYSVPSGYINLQVVKNGRRERFNPIGDGHHAVQSGDMTRTRRGFRFEASYTCILSDRDEAGYILDFFTDPSTNVLFWPYDDFNELVMYLLIQNVALKSARPLDSSRRILELTVEGRHKFDTLPWPGVDRSGWQLTMYGVD